MRTCDTCGVKMGPIQARERNPKTGARECPSCAHPSPRGVAQGFINIATHVWAEGPHGDILLRPGHYTIAAIDDRGTWVEHEGTKVVLAETHVASEDYPVLSEILVERPPLERQGSRRHGSGWEGDSYCPDCGWKVEWDDAESKRQGSGLFFCTNPDCDRSNYPIAGAEVLDSPKRQASRKMAHDSGDGETIYHCFAGETRFWTRDGLRRFDEVVGTEQMVLTAKWDGDAGADRFGGRWVEAEIRSFGEQSLLTVTLSRNGIKKVVRATPEHRWLIRAGEKRARNRMVVTSDLKSGDRLSFLFPKTRIARTTPSPVGIMAGLVFGDGTRTGAHGCYINLWGEKDAQMLRYFPEASVTTPIKTPSGVEGVRVLHLPNAFKDLPDLEESVPYLYGWLAGYFAADGTVSTQGQVTLASTSRDRLEFVEHLATRLGIGTYGIRSQNRQGYGDEPTPLHYLEFVGSTLRPSFFLIQEHRNRYEARDYAYERLGWVVESVEDHDEVEEVFCAVVPDTESFVLEGNLWTLNCPFCGSGNVVGRSDGTVECAYCNSTFTVQVQPANPNMPQTVDGQPYDIPGMPGQIDKPQSGDGAEPPSPGSPPAGDIGADIEGDNPGPEIGEPAGQPGESKAPEEDKSEDKEKDNPFAKSSRLRFIDDRGLALTEDQYVAHLARKHGGRAKVRR